MFPVGHPRTPWTVKYQPNDSNIVVSGCLGYQVTILLPYCPHACSKMVCNISNIYNNRRQVRVWDIANDFCTACIHFENSIISISFHPGGQFIAVASGPALRLWDWTKDANPRTCVNAEKLNTTPMPNKRVIPHPR